MERKEINARLEAVREQLAVSNFRKYYITEIKITIPKLSGNNRKLSFTKWDDLSITNAPGVVG